MATINGVVQPVARLGADPRIRTERVDVLGHNRRKGGSQSLVATDPAELLVVRHIAVENGSFDTVAESFETIEQRIMPGRHKSAHDQKIEPDLHHVSLLLAMSALALRPWCKCPVTAGIFETMSLTDPMGIDRITEAN